MCIRSLTLPGSEGGLVFLFKPDFSKLTAAGVLDALSLGAGIMITYGSYIHKNENLGSTAFQVALADTVIALLAGIAIFAAVFAFGPMLDVTFFGKNIFDLADFSVSNMGLPLGGLAAVLFVSWGLGRGRVEDELTSGGRLKIGYMDVFMFTAKYLAPLGIAIVFLHSLKVL